MISDIRTPCTVQAITRNKSTKQPLANPRRVAGIVRYIFVSVRENPDMDIFEYMIVASH